MLLPIRHCILYLKRHVLLILVLALFFLILKFGTNFLKSKLESPISLSSNPIKRNIDVSLDSPKVDSVKNYLNKSKINRLNSLKGEKKSLSEKLKVYNVYLAKLINLKPFENPNYNIHIFYYPWYRNLDYDGEWKHWNHEYIPNWKKNDIQNYTISGKHNPPDDIGSNFYPNLGCYSSRDPQTINIHMQQMKDAGIGVLIVSWYPPEMKDSPDAFFINILDIASNYNLTVAPHVEPYENRNIINLHIHIKYFINKYGKHKSLHRMEMKEKQVPVFYIYDSYRIPSSEWKQLLSQNGRISVRGTEYDGIFFGLIVDVNHKFEIKRSRFDGLYTYFATNGFSYGSTWKNWQNLGEFARDNGLLFSPSVGPGYLDSTVRPWNIGNSRHRSNGHYYEFAWRAAMATKPPIISITSFNEWHEGTQIEPAIPKKTEKLKYLDYEPEGPYYYLNLTNYWIHEYNKV